MARRIAVAAALTFGGCTQPTTHVHVVPSTTTTSDTTTTAAPPTSVAVAERTTTTRASRSSARQRPAVPVPSAAAGSEAVWACIRRLESGGNYRANTGNSHYGAYQFSQATWDSMHTGYARADLAPPAVQDDAARRLQARSGWSQWTTARRCGVAA